jgi:replication fork protection complex subunit Csm3/Swi3
LSDRGFPALIKQAQQFKPQGKGHEVLIYLSIPNTKSILIVPQAADLDRLMDLYQMWAHRMFPKTQFRDTIEKVERVCRQKRMLVSGSLYVGVFPEPGIGEPEQMAS